MGLLKGGKGHGLPAKTLCMSETAGHPPAAAAITKPRRPGALDDKLIPLRSGDKKSKFKLLTDAVSGLKTVFLLCPHGVAEARELPGVARRKH